MPVPAPTTTMAKSGALLLYFVLMSLVASSATSTVDTLLAAFGECMWKAPPLLKNPFPFFACFAPEVARFLFYAERAAARGIAAAHPAVDEQAYRFAKAAHDARARAVPEDTRARDAAASEGEGEGLSTDKAAEIDSPAHPEADPAEATKGGAKAEERPPTERSSTPTDKKPTKPKKPEKNRTTAAEEPLAEPGCYPVTEGRSVFTPFLFWDATAPLSLPFSNYSIDTLQAEAGLNCAMRDAMEGCTPATWKEGFAWLTLANFITRRRAVASLFFNGWWVTMRHFGFWAGVWAILGCAYLNAHAAVQTLALLSTFGSLLFSIGFIAVWWFAKQPEPAQRAYTRLWDTDPSMKWLKEKTAEATRFIVAWDRLLALFCPHAGFVVFPVKALLWAWGRTLGGAAPQVPRNANEFHAQFAAFVVETRAQLRDLRAAQQAHTAAEPAMTHVLVALEELKRKVDERAHSVPPAAIDPAHAPSTAEAVAALARQITALHQLVQATAGVVVAPRGGAQDRAPPAAAAPANAAQTAAAASAAAAAPPPTPGQRRRHRDPTPRAPLQDALLRAREVLARQAPL